MKHKLKAAFLVGLFFSFAAAAWLWLQSPFPNEPTTAVAAAREVATSAPSGHRPAVVATVATEAQSRTDEFRAPAARRIGTRSVVVAAGNFPDLLETYDPFARSALEHFSQRYHGAIAFDSHAERDWLASNGYPLAEEIVAAANMPLRELRAMADTGDEKAEFLYFDRLIEDLMRARDNHLGAGLPPETLGENREYLEAFVAVDEYRTRVADNGSPFTGHILARFYELTLADPYAAIGALYLSGSRGDHEATAAAEELVRHYRLDEDIRDALASFSLVVRDGYSGGYQASPRPRK